MPEATSFSILPTFTPEQGKQINKSIEQRDTADYNCFMALKSLMKVAGSDVKAMLTKWGYFDIIEDIDTALEEREKANETLMKTITQAGQNEHKAKNDQG